MKITVTLLDGLVLLSNQPDFLLQFGLSLVLLSLQIPVNALQLLDCICMLEGAFLRELVLVLKLPIFELYLFKVRVFASVFRGDGCELMQEGV